MKNGFLICCLFLLSQTTVFPQQNDGFFKEVEIYLDTMVYKLSEHHLVHQGEKHLYFEYQDESQVCDVRAYPANPGLIDNIRVMHSKDYQFIDSVIYVNNEYLRFKIEFENLNHSKFLRFNFLVQQDTIEKNEVVNLFPVTKTEIDFTPISDELYIGEEKVFELITNNPDNIRYSSTWSRENTIDYRVTKRFNQLRLHVLPNKTGNQTLNLTFQAYKPFMNEEGKLIYELPAIQKDFYVKKSRLRFLHVNEKEVTLDDKSRLQGVEIQIENAPNLQLNKTYRVEAQEEKGGALIAELHTRQTLSNDKVLCWLRTYNYHKSNQGYLYIKDGDMPRFITNFNITPKTKIEKISLLHQGKNWTTSRDVNPGEVVDVKIEGEGLHKANFHFEDVNDITTDSMIRNEHMVVFKLEVPKDITKKTINLLNHSEMTGHALQVKEYQEPKEFDFVRINYGTIDRNFHGLKSPVLFDQTIKDIVLSFVPERIDQGSKIHGKQYLELEIKITGPKGELIELERIENIVVCPDKYAVRYKYYDKSDCGSNDISLNNYLSKKTYNLPDWSKIHLVLKHDEENYNGDGEVKKMDIYLKKKYQFDVDVSFPAGLTTLKLNSKDRYSLPGGISMAMIGQFSFYHPDKIATLRPFKLGAGFIALNAFNFSEEADRDFGIVVLGSVYPIRKVSKFSFPLYLGGGYLIDSEKVFFLMGPGIRVKF